KLNTYYDVNAIRQSFPIAETLTYLDSGFQTPLSSPVRKALEGFLDESHKSAGPKAIWLNRLEHVRGELASVIGASSDEIAFTKNTSDAMNFAANALPLNPGDHVITIHGYHPNSGYAFLNLC